MRQLLLLCYMSVIFGGCTYYHTTSEPYAFPKETVWKTAYKIIEKRYDIHLAKKEEGTIETEWDYKLSPMYLESYRDRVLVQVERCDDCTTKKEEKKSKALEELGLELPDEDENDPDAGKEKYVVKISVERQQNRSLENPNSKDEAFWFPNGFNALEEQRIISLVQSQLYILKYLDKNEDEQQQTDDIATTDDKEEMDP